MMEQLSLFDDREQTAPLASRLRPDTLEEYVGQKHLIGEGKILRQLIEKDQVSSMIFWGPPGVGKTTLARIIAKQTRAEFVEFSAVTSGIREVKEVMNQAEQNRRMGIRTLLFTDEIHRFNKAQQDAFLPFVEKGSIILVGATTENPSFEINSALLSRCKVFILKALEEEDLRELMIHALKSPKGYGNLAISIEDTQLRAIARFSNGDARTALNTLEMAVLNGRMNQEAVLVVDQEILAQCMNRRSLLYDKNGEEHYNLISALHKSMRNSDPDAAVYWMYRMLDGGEEPLYIARRLIRFASEDVGMADSQALSVAVAAYQACHFLGMPECDVHLAHAVVYLSMAPKSNAIYQACEACKVDVHDMPAEPVPLQIRNAPTSLMKDLHYGEGYIYAHDTKEKLSRMQCLPDKLAGRRYYHPTEEGQEQQVKERLEKILKWKQQEVRMIAIRKGKPEDIPKVAQIYDHILSGKGKDSIGWIRGVYPTEQTAQDALEAGELFVMTEDDVVVAAAKINQTQVPEYENASWRYDGIQPEQIMVLHTLVVEPACSGKGYGSRFVAFYEEYALEQGCPYLRMDTNAKNTAARRLYKHLGYEEVGIVPCAFNGIPDVQLVCLEKKLG